MTQFYATPYSQEVLVDITDERIRQDAKWGFQHHPDGTDPINTSVADWARATTDRHAKEGTLTWMDIILEEIFEASAETDPVALRKELVQSAAVLAAWIEDIDSRNYITVNLVPSGLDKVRAAVRAARGGDAPAQVRGFA